MRVRHRLDDLEKTDIIVTDSVNVRHRLDDLESSE